ncbi:MAG: transglutaminase domain-containing protein [Halieaceae bacterium]|nr:transglutaminase domain-containing protein [Halieaceae bacterium]
MADPAANLPQRIGNRQGALVRPGPVTLLLALLLPVLLSACASSGSRTTGLEVPPLRFADEVYEVGDALREPEVDVLALSDEMRAFVARHTEGVNSPQRRLQALHQAVKAEDGLDMRYDPFADGDARQAFERGTANCLSYAHMFIALARHAGLDARYQWMEVRPEWHRIGERVAVRLHVNVSVIDRDGSHFMVDIDPLRRHEVAGSRIMSDPEGLALYHNNLAMMAFAEERPVEAWKSVVRGLRVAPDLSQLWVNLGAIYRVAGQDRDAEAAYHEALRVNRLDRSAMNNLVVLYRDLGKDKDADFWERKLWHYRDRNPYYHASLGDEALKIEDWESAYAHYRRALKLQPMDGQLNYALGIIEQHRGNLKAAERLLTRAVEKAAFPRERERYQVVLRSIREEQAAL